MKGHYNYSICKGCGGLCCQRCAGSYIPSDFKEPITVEFIVSLLQTGKVAIDWWEQENPIYYLRPRHVDEPAIKGSWGGTCVNWTRENGCSLPETERPYQCRMLVPALDLSCETKKKDKASKYDCAVAWKPHRVTILEAIDEYNK
jgi:hypothetical protein